MAYDLIKAVEHERDIIDLFNIGGFKDTEKLKAAYQTVIDDLYSRYTCPVEVIQHTKTEIKVNETE